jgi:hypothetical protein
MMNVMMMPIPMLALESFRPSTMESCHDRHCKDWIH